MTRTLTHRRNLTAALAAVLFWSACAPGIHADEPLEPTSLRQDWDRRVGDFSLTDAHGAPVTLESLRGKVWVAHFFYPTCQGPCTRTVPTMMKLQEALRGKSDYVLVSIALTGDAPELLGRFAADHSAEPKQWMFLTAPGDGARAQHIVEESFFQTARPKDQPKPGDEIDHTVNLMIVDREGFIRGYIDGQDARVVPLLVQRLRELAASRYVLPSCNAALNALAAVLMLAGWRAIKLRYERVHIGCMLAAVTASIVFLAGYLYFHFAILGGQPTRFRGEGWVRPVYFAILLTHTVLAAAVAPLVLYVTWQGWRDRRPRHVRVARWTLPIWLYVSVTGVIVYVLLYQVYPPY